MKYASSASVQSVDKRSRPDQAEYSNNRGQGFANKRAVGDLSDIVKQILDAANEGMISPAKMFRRLRTVAATMGADRQLKHVENAKINDLGVMGEYLADLPYRSDVLNLDEETWKSWDGLAQEIHSHADNKIASLPTI